MWLRRQLRTCSQLLTTTITLPRLLQAAFDPAAEARAQRSVVQRPVESSRQRVAVVRVDEGVRDPRHPAARILARREVSAVADLDRGGHFQAELAVADVDVVARGSVLERLDAHRLGQARGSGVVDALAERVEQERGQVRGGRAVPCRPGRSVAAVDAIIAAPRSILPPHGPMIAVACKRTLA